MHIVNQDRDRIFRFLPGLPIYVAPVFYEGKCYGSNLMMGRSMLGTFDTPEEAIAEASAIYNYGGEIYAVSGFSDFNADSIFNRRRMQDWEN